MYHGHGVQLLQRGHGLKQQNDQSTAFHGLDRPRQQVRRQGLEVLQDTHPVGVPKDLLGLFVVYIADVREGDEELERVFGVGFTDAALDLFLDLCFALLAVAAEEGVSQPVGKEMEGM